MLIRLGERCIKKPIFIVLCSKWECGSRVCVNVHLCQCVSQLSIVPHKTCFISVSWLHNNKMVCKATPVYYRKHREIFTFTLQTTSVINHYMWIHSNPKHNSKTKVPLCHRAGVTRVHVCCVLHVWCCCRGRIGSNERRTPARDLCILVRLDSPFITDPAPVGVYTGHSETATNPVEQIRSLEKP